MKPDLCVGVGFLLALLATAFTAHAEDFVPGVQHICIPNATGDGWDCGTIDDPPRPAVVEEEADEKPAPLPPRFLMDPDAPPRPSEALVEEASEAEPAIPAVAAEPAVPEPAAPIIDDSPSASAPLSDAEVTPPEPETIQPPTAEPSAPIAVAPMESEPLPEPVAAETEALPEPEAPAIVAPADEPAAAPVAQDAPTTHSATEESVTADAAAAEPAHTSAVDMVDTPVSVESMPEPESAPAPPVVEPEPVATPVAVAPAPSTPAATPVAHHGRLYLSSLQGARDFAKLPPAYFTLQLAHASSAEPFPALIQQLGIDHRQCYVLRVRGDAGDRFVLAYGSFADATIAKAALMQIRPAPGMTAVWPRRVGYLQGEYRP